MIVILVANDRRELFPAAAFCPKVLRLAVAPCDRANHVRPVMNVETILRTKGSAVATIRPDETVGAVVKELISRNVGALVVSEDGETVDGIISERDIVQGLPTHGAGRWRFTATR